MAAANNLLKGGGGLLLSRWSSRSFAINGGGMLPLLPQSPLKPFLSLSLISFLNCAPCSPRRRHVSCLCTSADTGILDSSSSPGSPTPAPATSSSLTPAVPDIDAVKDVAKLLDIRVGKVLKAWVHPDADSLYVEEVDIGEEEPRTICSGLVRYVPVHDLQDKKVIVLANLKPRNMRGIKSCGMLMAASDASHENVELLVPPEDSIPGERIWFGFEDEKENQLDAASPNQIQKKKIWEAVQPHLKTTDACIAVLGGNYMRTSAGPVVSKSLKNANIS